LGPYADSIACPVELARAAFDQSYDEIASIAGVLLDELRRAPGRNPHVGQEPGGRHGEDAPAGESGAPPLGLLVELIADGTDGVAAVGLCNLLRRLVVWCDARVLLPTFVVHLALPDTPELDDSTLAGRLRLQALASLLEALQADDGLPPCLCTVTATSGQGAEEVPRVLLHLIADRVLRQRLYPHLLERVPEREANARVALTRVGLSFWDGAGDPKAAANMVFPRTPWSGAAGADKAALRELYRLAVPAGRAAFRATTDAFQEVTWLCGRLPDAAPAFGCESILEPCDEPVACARIWAGMELTDLRLPQVLRSSSR